MNKFTLRHFFLDRIPYLAAFLIAFVLIILVVSLDLLGSGYQLGWHNLFYMSILAAVTFAAVLLLDYARQRQYFQQLNEAAGAGDNLGSTVRIQDAATREQLLMQQLLQIQNKSYLDKLSQLQLQQEQNYHFITQWVHQMKTPVSVIDLMIQQSEQAESIAEAHALFESIGEENEQLQRGLETVLYTARLQKFELDVIPRQVDLPTLIRNVVNQHKKTWIRWSVFPKITGDAAVVQTDGKWMAFALNQIVSNAIKYSKGTVGSKQLLFNVQKDKYSCQLQIIDQGIGIPEQDLPRVFDVFFTGSNGRTAGDSTGMGLFLAKQICNKLGHTIGISSTVGEGTTVTITFANRSIHDF